MTEKKKEEKTDTTVKKITKDKGLFTARLSKTAEIEGFKFDLRPLPNIVQTYITGKMIGLDGDIDLALRKIEYLRFGIVKVYDEEGKEISSYVIKDEKGDEVTKNIFMKQPEKVMGRPYGATTYDFLDEYFHPDVLDILFTWIQGITHLSPSETEKLDFTIPSLDKE